MPIQDLLEGDSNEWVAWHVEHGWTEEQILSAMRQRWPGESGSTYHAAYVRGARAYGAAVSLENAGADNPFTAAEIGGQVPGWYNYRYMMWVQLEDQETGNQDWRTFEVVSGHSLSFNELTAAAVDWAAGITPHPGTPGSPPQDFTAPIVTRINMISIERTK